MATPKNQPPTLLRTILKLRFLVCS